MALLTVALLTRWLYLRDDSTCYRWALYTEKLAREFGFFKTEPDGSEGYDLLGHFGDELMRAARLVVDTGLHHLGWSRQQAIEYMEDHTYTPSQPLTPPLHTLTLSQSVTPPLHTLTTPHNPSQPLTAPYNLQPLTGDRVHGGPHDPRPVGCGHRGSSPRRMWSPRWSAVTDRHSNLGPTDLQIG